MKNSDIEFLYNKKVKAVYINICHKTRRIVNIVFSDNSRKSIMYGKMLLQIKFGRLLSNDETCDHIDGDSLNDSLENLQILTRVENSSKGPKELVKFNQNRVLSERMIGVSQSRNDGELNGRSKLSNEQVSEIKIYQRNYFKGQDKILSDKYNVSRETIKGIRLGYFRKNC